MNKRLFNSNQHLLLIFNLLKFRLLETAEFHQVARLAENASYCQVLPDQLLKVTRPHAPSGAKDDDKDGVPNSP